MLDKDTAPVPGYEGAYAVTRSGIVVSITRRVRPNTPPFALRTFDTEDGYLRVALSVGGKRKNHLVHRLVATAWLGSPPDESYEVNHIDGVKRNNSVGNLEWVTRAENMAHAKRLGLRPVQVGDSGTTTRIKTHQLPELIESLKVTGNTKVTAEQFGIDRTTVVNTLRRFGVPWGRKGFVSKEQTC